MHNSSDGANDNVRSLQYTHDSESLDVLDGEILEEPLTDDGFDCSRHREADGTEVVHQTDFAALG